ncbi:TonB-dependent siderophore receptor [uncultured Microscilla sp.]|uniref:TonB-dependent receptor plug domain-containing protein n=1 Tax=uncultured Microscilla sp. TaxID=432653 RepID=UPI0026058AF9|nr:TonB-dependent receptor [uncultured Microscilla sp.]
MKYTVMMLLLCLGLGARGQIDSLNNAEWFRLKAEELIRLEQVNAETEILGASQYAQKLENVPASVIVVNQKQMKENGYHDLSDLLKDLPGVDVIENAGRFGEYYTIRGINGNDRFLVLIDGRKLNAMSGTFLSVGNSISLGFADRVEIVYGSSSIIYGSDAFSGVINIISQKTPPKTNYSFSASYGSFNTLDVSSNAHIKVNADLSLVFYGRLFKSDGFDNEPKNGYEIVKDYQQPIANEFAQPINDHNAFIEARYKDLKVGLFRQYFDEGNARGIQPSIYLYSEENRWIVHKNIYWANYQTTLSNGGVLTTDLSYTQHQQDKDTRFFRFIAPNDPSQTQNQFVTGKDETVKGFFTYNQKFKKRLDFIIGIQYENTHSIPAYANDEVLGRPLKYQGSVVAQINDALTVKEQKIGAFTQIAYTPFEQLNITAGARYDYSQLFENTINPRVAVIYKPVKNSIIKFIYGTAFQAPSLFYTYEQFGGPTVVMIPNSQQNFTLQNQRIQSYELDFTQKIKKVGRINITGFYNRASNLIERRLYTQNIFNKYFNTNTAGLRNENIGSVEALGVSLNASLNLHKNFDAQLIYTYTDAQQKVSESSDSTPLPRVAAHKLSVGFTLRNLLRYITLSSRTRWVGDINTPQASNIYPGDEKAPGYLMVSLALSVTKLLPYTRFFARMEHMIGGNNEHVGIFEGGIYTDVIPQPTFNGRFGMEVNF